jgi:hypothetical protein
MKTLNSFNFEKKPLKVKFIEEVNVKKGVICEVYEFEGDNSKDLGIVTVDQNSKTPLQKVLQGKKTIEGYIAGKGQLKVTKLSGEVKIYQVDQQSGLDFSVIVEVGETMQWQADAHSQLTFYEICYPPYKDGRFENLVEQ